MDVGKALSYVFDDPRWLNKFLVGSLVLLISFLLLPFLGLGLVGFLIVTGYTLEVLRNLRQGYAEPLPEWRERWTEWLILGFKMFVVGLVWALPGILFNGATQFGNLLIDNDLGLFGAPMVIFGTCLALLWWIVVALVSPALYIRLAETEDIAAGLQFREIYEFTRDNIGEVIVAVIVAVIAGLVVVPIASMVGLLLCLVGIAILLPAAILYSSLVEVHLFAQIGRTARAPGQAVTPVAEAAETETPAPMETEPSAPAETETPEPGAEGSEEAGD